MKRKDSLLDRADRARAEALALRKESVELRQLGHLERELEAAVAGLMRVLRPFGIRWGPGHK